MPRSEKMRFTVLMAVVTVIAMFAGCSPAAVEEAVESTTVGTIGVEPVNDLPNPYERIEPWAELPDGQPWAAVTGAEPGPDGNLTFFIDVLKTPALAGPNRRSSSSTCRAMF